jgi:hypothetical protein
VFKENQTLDDYDYDNPSVAKHSPLRYRVASAKLPEESRVEMRVQTFYSPTVFHIQTEGR